MNVMKIMAILAAAAAVPSADAARSLKAANIAAYRQSGCEHGSCDPCHDLQKIQCNADSQCEYTIGVDRSFERGDAGSGSGCRSKSAYKRITGGGHGRIGGGEVNKAMAEMGCSQMYSHRDCKRQNEDAVGNSCAWDDCWENDYPHCVESADVKTDCAPEPIAPTCAIPSDLGQGVVSGSCSEGGALGVTCQIFCDPNASWIESGETTTTCTAPGAATLLDPYPKATYQGHTVSCEALPDTWDNRAGGTCGFLPHNLWLDENGDDCECGGQANSGTSDINFNCII